VKAGLKSASLAAMRNRVVAPQHEIWSRRPESLLSGDRPRRSAASLEDVMITPTPAELQVFAVAVGFLITGSFMRYVWKSPAQNRSRKPPARRPSQD
jgi:hypothetical protein